MENLICKTSRRRFGFDTFFDELIKFKDQYHHINVAQDYVTEDGYKLGLKVRSIRTGNIRTSEIQKQKLDSVGFVWDARTFNFDTFFKELIKFKNTHHHLKIHQNYVTGNGYKLGKKVNSIRTCVIKLSKTQKQKLDEIGFIWDVREYNFNLFYNELIKFKDRFHHLKVPKDYVSDEGYKLGIKVNCIRLGLIKVTEIQKESLNDIGFVWAIRRKSKLRKMDFSKFYAQLVNYKMQFHNLYVPYDYIVDNLELGFYVRNIRNHCIELSEDERLSLISLGLEFNTHNSLYPGIEYSINDDTSLLITNMLNGDMCARDTLITEYLPFAKNIVLKYFPVVDKDDIHDIAYESLITCIDNVNETSYLSSYIYKTVKGKVHVYLRERKKCVSLYSAKSKKTDLEQIDTMKDEHVTPETMDNNIFQSQLSAKLKTILTKQEYRIICLYSGFNKNNTKYSISSIAKFFNTDEEYIEKEITRILKILNTELDVTEWNI